jgi:hypothetical protein
MFALTGAAGVVAVAACFAFFVGCEGCDFPALLCLAEAVPLSLNTVI